MTENKKKLEEIRKSIQAENVSYSELVELQSLVAYIDADDVELLESAGVWENEQDRLLWGINQIADRMYCYGEDITPKEAQKMASELWDIAEKLTAELA